MEPLNVSCTQALFMDIKVLELSLNVTPYRPSFAARIMGSCHDSRLQCEEQSTWCITSLIYCSVFSKLIQYILIVYLGD